MLTCRRGRVATNAPGLFVMLLTDPHRILQPGTVWSCLKWDSYGLTVPPGWHHCFTDKHLPDGDVCVVFRHTLSRLPGLTPATAPGPMP